MRSAVLVMVDTLRADHLGAYGYERPTSPNIDALARESVLFRQVRSQAPCTFPSVNSLLTSRDPIHFLGQAKGEMGIPARYATLPSILRAHGYRTAAVSASPVVRRTPSKFNRVGGYDRGFDAFDESCFRKPGACVNAVALDFLDALAGEPFFLYLHYMDVHDPYRPPASHPRRFALGEPATDFIAAGNPDPLRRRIALGEPLGLAGGDLQHLIDLYDEEIRYFDGQLRALLDALAERGLRDDTLIILLADHGEDFLERGEVKHCRSLHDTQIRTPLVVHVPGAAPREVEADVQNLDVAPTILDLLGIDASELKPEGRSLRPFLMGDAPANGPAFSAWRSSRAIVQDGVKLLVDLESGEARLYDLRADPAERADVGARRAAEAEHLRALLEARLDRVEADRARSLELGEEAVRRLRELGYLE